jgi:hypothetical protein
MGGIVAKERGKEMKEDYIEKEKEEENMEWNERIRGE